MGLFYYLIDYKGYKKEYNLAESVRDELDCSLYAGERHQFQLPGDSLCFMGWSNIWVIIIPFDKLVKRIGYLCNFVAAL